MKILFVRVCCFGKKNRFYSGWLIQNGTKKENETVARHSNDESVFYWFFVRWPVVTDFMSFTIYYHYPFFVYCEISAASKNSWIFMNENVLIVSISQNVVITSQSINRKKNILIQMSLDIRGIQSRHVI